MVHEMVEEEESLVVILIGEGKGHNVGGHVHLLNKPFALTHLQMR